MIGESVITVRNARVADAAAITAMVNRYADDGLMLPKTLMEVYEHVREFVVAVDEDNQVIGCGALRIMGIDLAEVRSLATVQEAQGRGVGSRIVEALLDEARTLGLHRIFALTYQIKFFERLGFRIVERHGFPEKVWADCKDCRKRNCCDETAMIRFL
ncbi:MAG: N-acetyltransferase [Armatimonadetes bacterium]|nr:N-acetyltransferase [Armatimonadota bacterium]